MFCIMAIFSILPAFTQTATPPAKGDGTELNPYQIATLENLYWLTQSETVWDKHFIQTANIDAESSSSWDNDSGFTAIGNITTAFTGSYNGKKHVIDKITIYRPNDSYIGLFGYVDSNSYLDSLGLINVNMTGQQYVGGIAGYVNDGQIKNCYTTGECSSAVYSSFIAIIGGFTGLNRGEISNCFSDVNVTTAGKHVAGLVGVNDGTITNSYSTGSVSGYDFIGGLVGVNNNTIKNCYSRSNLIYYISDKIRGGLVGYSYQGSVYNSFWDIEASGEITSFGGVGLTTSEMQDSPTYLNTGWDFMGETTNGNEDIWGLNKDENYGYPFLNFQGYSNTVNLECQAPFTPVSGIVFGDISSKSINLESFTKYGNGNTGYSIFINTEDSWDIPVDGSEPIADTSWQNNGQQCIYFGTSNIPNVIVKGLIEATEYYFKVYAYTNCSGTEVYEQSGTVKSQSTKVTFTIPLGVGSEDDPYIITNLKNLVWLMYSDTAWNKHFIQSADIDASSSLIWNEGKGFSPIGNSSKAFSGSYNGKGHIIDQLNINRPTEDNIGLFGKSNYIDIDSLGLTNVEFIGYNTVGGLVGYLYSGQATNCFSEGTINGNNEVGGLAGKNFGTITNSYSIAILTGISEVGGLVGKNSHNPYGPFTIEYCGKIRNSYAFSDITGSFEVGGLVGVNSGNITNSYSKGITKGNKEVGGLIGANYEFNYNIGLSAGRIIDSYSATEVIGNSSVGGLIGINWRGDVIGSFWDVENSGQSISGGGTGLTAIEMKDVKTYLYSGWDFMDESYNGTEDLWCLNSSENDGYPFLNWQGLINNAVECEAPSFPASNIVFGDIYTGRINLESYSVAGYGEEGYSVYINDEDTWTTPDNGTEPNADVSWQNNGQQCIYFGSSNNPSIMITDLSENTKYYFKIYAYNDCSGIEVYEQEGTNANQTTKVFNTKPNGNGHEDNPYIISNTENLAWVMYNDTAWDKNYIQTTDIDASNSMSWDNDFGFKPIGNSAIEFGGKYNGGGFTIDNLYINRPLDSLIGLFGKLNANANIENLGVTNINITGSKYVGGLAGYLKDGKIKNCHSSGICKSITSDTWWTATGGLVGFNDGKISFCFSDVNVKTTYDMAGGLVGVNLNYLSNSYSTGNVSGNSYIGGLIGVNFDFTQKCYSRSLVSSNTKICGGLMGDNFAYAIASFWDTETSGQDSNIGGEGLSTIEMQSADKYVNAGWDFMNETTNGTNDYWGLNSNENEGYPFLYWQGFTNTTIITTDINRLENYDIKIYPNPVNDILNITFGDEKAQHMTITSIIGEIIVDKIINSETDLIDMSGFTSGVYLVRIFKDNDVFTKKVIKK